MAKSLKQFLVGCGAAILFCWWHFDRRKRLLQPRVQRLPPLRERLTVIITTSPVRRHPSTELIDEVLASRRLALGTSSCDIIIVCDGYRRRNGDGIEFTQPNYRQGIADAESAMKYDAYKDVLRSRAVAAHGDAPSVQVLELDSRHGFGFAVRAALPLVKTPYILVMQHDRVVMREVDIPRVLAAMEGDPTRLKYVGLPTSTTIVHREHVLSKYGLRIEPFTIDAGGLQVLPLVQWYDSMHLAQADYYRNFVFGPRKLVVRGGFIEDKFGQAQLADIRARGVDVAHAEWGTYLLYGDGFAEPCVGHLDGRDEMNTRHFKHSVPSS